jgi:hypothetical protein
VKGPSWVLATTLAAVVATSLLSPPRAAAEALPAAGQPEFVVSATCGGVQRSDVTRVTRRVVRIGPVNLRIYLGPGSGLASGAGFTLALDASPGARAGDVLAQRSGASTCSPRTPRLPAPKPR